MAWLRLSLAEAETENPHEYSTLTFLHIYIITRQEDLSPIANSFAVPFSAWLTLCSGTK